MLRRRFEKHAIGAWSPGLCESLADRARYVSAVFCYILSSRYVLTE